MDGMMANTFAAGTIFGGTIIGLIFLFSRRSVFPKILGNLENIIFFMAVAMFIASVILDYLDVTKGISTLMLNFFSTIIFSWILTKKSTELSFKAEQEKLAKLSYRHLGDVEKSVLGLYESITDFLEDNQNDDSLGRVCYFLRSLSTRTEDIRNGIESNKEDWFDMLSDEERERIKEMEDPEAEYYDNKVLERLFQFEDVFPKSKEDEEEEN